MNPVPFCDLRLQYDECRTEIDAALAGVIENSAFVNGPDVAEFERELAADVGVREAVGCNSATAAGWMVMRGLGIGSGDNVVTTAHSYVASAEYMTMVGARPQFADIDPRTYQLCPRAAEAAINGQTRAILLVHLYGIPCDMDAFLEIGQRHGLPVIEDCAQAQGAQWRGTQVGALGRAGCFSFFPSKNLGAFGDAGAVTTNDPGLGEFVRKCRDHGRRSKYEHDFPGANERLDTLQAAVLRVKLSRLERWNQRRRELAQVYGEMFAQVAEVVVPEIYDGSLPAWHLYVIRAAERDRLEDYLKSVGISTGRHYPKPIHLQPSMSDGWKVGDLPETERVCREILSLPMYPHMELDTARQVAEAVARFYGRVV